MVSVPMIDAVETFVHTLADSNDDRAAAALVLESACATATSVSVGSDGTSSAVSQVYRGFSSDPSLRTLAASMFANLDSESTTVAVLGSSVDEDWIIEQLSDLTPLCLTVPAECELALARGAAMVAAQKHAGDGRSVRPNTTPSTTSAPRQTKSKPLLFVPRTARLATLDETCEPEPPTSVPSETPRKPRGLATTPLLAAMLIMVSFTLLASLVVLTNESSAHSAPSSGESLPPVALPSPSASGIADLTESVPRGTHLGTTHRGVHHPRPKELLSQRDCAGAVSAEPAGRATTTRPVGSAGLADSTGSDRAPTPRHTRGVVALRALLQRNDRGTQGRPTSGVASSRCRSTRRCRTAVTAGRDPRHHPSADPGPGPVRAGQFVEPALIAAAPA